MNPSTDPATVRGFVTAISEQAQRVCGHSDGLLQLTRIHPADSKLAWTRWRPSDVDGMVAQAITDAEAGHNVYCEPRLIRRDTPPGERGKAEHTAAVFALVVDSDGWKDGAACEASLDPSLAVETSPGSHHRWHFLDRGITDAEAKEIGAGMREAGGDSATGRTGLYRVAGTLNYPDKKKIAARGPAVHSVKLAEPLSGVLYTADDLRAAFPRAKHQRGQNGTAGDAGADWRLAWLTLPDTLKTLIRDGVPEGQRSEKFHSAVGWLKRLRWTFENVVALLEAHPNGIAAKYVGRLREEVERSFGKVDGPGERPVIQLQPGTLDTQATVGEQALIAAGVPFYAHADELQRPIIDEVEATRGRKAKIARFATVTPDMLRDHLSRSARWEKFNERKKAFVPTDPPRDVAAIILSRVGEWRFLRAVGVITTPTLRPDGTILDQPGYDPTTRLILMDPPELPAISESPTREEATEAIGLLNGLLAEFPFNDEASRSVALSELITPVVRGAMTVAPMHANRAPTPGSGKSYILDLASAISSGQPCPVISAGADEYETEKRLGAALLKGQSLIAIDNLNGELRGDALCQMIERPIVDVRVLGFSRLVRIESRATVFATGNNLVLVGDVVRRVVLCTLDPNMERPELRQFKRNPVEMVLAERGRYIAAALTVVRGYLAAGCPNTLPPLASFEDWSRLVRSALVWLGHADPVKTMEAARAEDPELDALRRVVAAWREDIGTDRPHTTSQLKERAEKKTNSGEPYDFNKGSLAHPDLHEALLSVSYSRGDIDTRKLGRWLGRYRGRVINGCKLVAREDTHTKQLVWLLTSHGPAAGICG